VVTDYRTSTTGITEQHLRSGAPLDLFFIVGTASNSSPAEALPFNSVQQRVSELIKGKVLIGHSLWNDLSGSFGGRPCVIMS
jgi:RNA exonuclease 4